MQFLLFVPKHANFPLPCLWDRDGLLCTRSASCSCQSHFEWSRHLWILLRTSSLRLPKNASAGPQFNISVAFRKGVPSHSRRKTAEGRALQHELPMRQRGSLMSVIYLTLRGCTGTFNRLAHWDCRLRDMCGSGIANSRPSQTERMGQQFDDSRMTQGQKENLGRKNKNWM